MNSHHEVVSDLTEATGEAGNTNKPLPAPRPFTIDNERAANWLIRRVLEARRYRQRVREWAALEEQRTQRVEERLLSRYGQQLERWVRGELAHRRPTRKCLDLPAGRVGVRQQKTKLAVEDLSLVLAWARDIAPHLVRTIESVGKGDLNEYVQRTGELPPGVALEPEGEHLYIR